MLYFLVLNEYWHCFYLIITTSSVPLAHLSHRIFGLIVEAAILAPGALFSWIMVAVIAHLEQDKILGTKPAKAYFGLRFSKYISSLAHFIFLCSLHFVYYFLLK